MSTYTEFWKLKEIVVWNVQNYNLDKLDITFKLAYWENLKYAPFSDFVDYKVDRQKIIERTQDLDNFARLLSERWIHVIRPEELSEYKTFKTPNFSWVLWPVSNPRDRALIFGNKIIETPAMCRKRYFENQLMYKIFLKYFHKWYAWISAPYPLLWEENIDSDYWLDQRDFNNFDRNKYDISFDAANLIKIWKDILFNISSYNHELWADWLQNILWSDVQVHKVYCLDDNHIDWKISVLRPGTFLVNNSMMEKNIQSYLPKKFHHWEYIYTSDYHTYPEDYYNSWSSFVQLSSMRWMDTNVLSLDEKTVCVIDTAINTIAVLKEKGFCVIPVQMRHCELFGWGLHCATLDIDRQDACIDYTQT